MDEDELSKLRRRETGSRKLLCALVYQLVEQPSQYRCVWGSSSDMNQRRQDIGKKPSARRVQADKAADLKTLLAPAEIYNLADVWRKYRRRFNGYCRQIARQDKGPLDREKRHVSRFNPHRPLHAFEQSRRKKLDPKEFPLLRQSGAILFDKFDRRYKEGLDLMLRGASPKQHDM